MKQPRTALRYAKSLLGLAVERGELEAVYGEMLTLRAAIENHRELELMLRSPIVKPDKKLAVLNRLFGERLGKTSLSFIALITRKKRDAMLGEITAKFADVYKEYKGILTAEVISAGGLDEAMRKRVLALITDSAKSEVELTEKVDKELIGGFILRIGDKRYNASVAHRLQELRKTFRENPFVKDF